LPDLRVASLHIKSINICVATVESSPPLAGNAAASIPILAQEGWQLLRTHLDLADRFALIVLTAPDENTLNLVRLELMGATGPDQPRREIVFQPMAPARTLTEQILDNKNAAPPLHYLWVSAPASIHDPAAVDLKAWREAFTYLNQHRNRLRKELTGTLIIAGTAETLATLREYAPDLWSIRSALIQFSSGLLSPAAMKTLFGEFKASVADLADLEAQQSRLAAYKRSLLAAFAPYQELALDNYAAADQACPDIWDIFVHPACSQEHLRPEDMDAAQRETPPRLPAQDLLPILGSDTERRHVLLADPGMGKSTLIQSLIAHLASGRPLAGAPALNGLLPVPLILRDLVPLLPQDQVEGWTWDSLITVLLEQYQREETAPVLLEAYCGHAAEFRQIIHSSDQVFFLIDGLDEIGDIKKRQQIVRAIQEGFRNADKGARWLITSRVIGYDEAQVHFVGRRFAMDKNDKSVPRNERKVPWTTAAIGVRKFIREWQDWKLSGTGWDEDDRSELEALEQMDSYENEDWVIRLKARSLEPKLKAVGKAYICRLPIARRLYLAPFDDRRQDAFTSRWFRHRHSTDYSKELMREVRAHHHDGVRIISRVPNLLCMMNMLKRSGKPLPDGRAVLYDEIVKAYLGGIDAAYKFKPTHGHTCPFEASERRFLLSLLGAHMQQTRLGRAADLSAAAAAIEVSNALPSSGELTNADGNILISMPELAQLLIPAIEAMQQAGKVKSDHSAAALLDELLHHIASRSGLLIPRSSDEHGNTVYGFTHLSFLEFFAAEWLGREFDRLQKRLARQAEAMADGMTLTEADLDREFPAPQSIEHKRSDFPKLAASPVWHEPLIFLVESRKSDTATLLRWLFPQLHSNKPYTVPEDEDKAVPLMPMETVRLAVQLAHDQELSLSPEIRRQWWRTLWAAYLIWPHLPWEQERDKRWPIAPLLLDRAEQRTEVLQALVEVYTKGLGLPAKLPPPPLFLYHCSHLTSSDLLHLTGLGKLETLSLFGCAELESMPDLSTMQSLKRLDLGSCTGLNVPEAFSELSVLHQLEELDLDGCTGLERLPDLSAMQSLVRLNLIGCTGLRGSKALIGLKRLEKLEKLYLNGCTGLESLPDMGAMQNLKSLNLSNCAGLRSNEALVGLTGLSGLKELCINSCTGLERLPDLSAMKGLKTLDMRGCSGLRGPLALNGLTSLAQLRSLLLIGCSGLECLPDLSALKSLKTIFLLGCTGLRGYQSLSGLAGSRHLKTLNLHGCTGLTEADVEEIRKMVGPQCQVFF
jgi:hypothetical protein